tara:strand:+ start:4161 stop:5762 length:1602 start_codon:yes stop_codon:yes gene_type:complete
MRRIIYNDDSQGVHEARPGHARPDLEAWIDQALTLCRIDTYVWCICYPDIAMHRTRTGEVYGARFPEPPNAAAAVIAELHTEGTDVLEVVAARARNHGVEFIAGMRMNDTHGMYPDPNDPQMARFLIDHPEYVIARQDGIPERALDYSHREVRDHRLAILRELAENYDIDGVELDFTRWAKFFAREEAPFKTDIMSDFVAEARAILDGAAAARGRGRLTLGVQVQESLYLNHLCGLDPRAWVERGWIDFLIQADWNCTNPHIPVAEFAAFCRDANCTHHVRMGNMMGGGWGAKPFATGRKTAAYKGNKSYGGMVLTPEEARGAAANIYGFGADGIGLWNICCNLGAHHKADATGPDRSKFQRDMIDWIAAVDAPEKVWAAPRHYHFLPVYKKERLLARNYPVNGHNVSPTGAPCQIVEFDAKSRGFRQVYRFPMADGRNGENLRGHLRLRILAATPDDRFAFDINGVALDRISASFEEDDELPAIRYEADLGCCPPFAGANELGMTLLELGARRDGSAPYMEELEIIVEEAST